MTLPHKQTHTNDQNGSETMIRSPPSVKEKAEKNWRSQSAEDDQASGGQTFASLIIIDSDKNDLDIKK